ncbi:MAG: TonB-dependent receptor [Candidatus Marinimicrobia bacterium]|nr:TonB-dependent receptor [Candidatus Neomarinimicrobiota bacterium]
MQIAIKKWLIFALLIISAAWSGTTGKIAGRLTDAQTLEPLIAANVILQGTAMGAATDMDGSYFILNIPPGSYTVQASYIGHTAVMLNNVKVSVDQTTRVNFDLQPEALVGEMVVAVAKRLMVEKDLTSTMAKISGDEIAALPVEDIEGLINLQAGVVDGHFRGGRKNEVKYLIDGIAVNDVYSGDFSMKAETNSIQEIQVLSGTFNAEYGEALSGIVNQVTKVPGNSYSGNISAYSGDYISNRDAVFKNIDNITPSDVYNLQGSLSGPVPGAGQFLKFYLSGRRYNDQGYIYGQRIFRPWDYSNFSDNDPNEWYIGASGDSAYVAMKYSERTSFQGKLHIKIGASKWLVIQGLYQNRDYRDYDHKFQLNPDGDYSRFQKSYLGSISYTHVFSPATFMDIKGSSFITESRQYVYEDPLDVRYVHPEFKRFVSGNAFLSAGTENWHFFHETKTHTGKIDLTSQINNVHQIKTGIELQQHEMEYEDFQTQVNQTLTYPYYDSLGMLVGFEQTLPEEGAFNYNTYNNNPYQFAGYIQDKIELDYLIVNLGIRFDYFEPDGTTLNDPNNIAALDDLHPPFPDSLFTKASTKYQISPRVGISYPMSDRGAIHISYGHFFQIPAFEYLYRNPNFRIPLTGDFPENVGNVIGNADLEPQRTTIYEIGLQQEIITGIGVTATAYYKDIRNLLGQKLYIKNEFKKFGQYVNRDYGSVRGFTLSFERRLNGGFGANVDYTYQIAKGNASDPNDEFENAQKSPPIESNKQLVPLNWDRTHSLNFTVTIGTPGDFIGSFIGKLGSGLPYTPSLEDQRTGLENSDNRPTFFNVDFFLTKYISFNNANISVFVKAYNLFDIDSETEVFGDTGRAGYTLELTRAQADPRGVNTIQEYFTRPDYYSAPRQVILGVSYSF